MPQIDFEPLSEPTSKVDFEPLDESTKASKIDFEPIAAAPKPKSPTPASDKALSETSLFAGMAPVSRQQQIEGSTEPTGIQKRGTEEVQKVASAAGKFVTEQIPRSPQAFMRAANIPTDWTSPVQLAEFAAPAIKPMMDLAQGAQARTSQIYQAWKNTPPGSQERYDALVGAGLDAAQIAAMLFTGGEAAKIGRTEYAKPISETAPIHVDVLDPGRPQEGAGPLPAPESGPGVQARGQGQIVASATQKASQLTPGDLWYQGVSAEGGTPWVTHDINIARSYALRRGPNAKINVYTPEQVGETAFADTEGNLMSPQEYAKTNWSTTIQTGGKPLPKPTEVLPVSSVAKTPTGTGVSTLKPQPPQETPQPVKTWNIRGDDISTGDPVKWMSGGTWDGIVQDAIKKPTGTHDVLVNAIDGTTFWLKDAEHYGMSKGKSKFAPEGWGEPVPIASQTATVSGGKQENALPGLAVPAETTAPALTSPESADVGAVPQTGIANKYLEEVYGDGSPAVVAGKGPKEWKALGQARLDDFQATGNPVNDPYAVLTALREGKVPVAKLPHDVSLLRAEHQRLVEDARLSEGTPQYPQKAQAAFDMATAIKQVAHGPASDVFRSLQEHDAPRYDNVTDFDQATRERLKREATPEEKTHFRKIAQDVRTTSDAAGKEVEIAQKQVQKYRGKEKMSFEDAAKSIHDQISQLVKDCGL